MDAWNTFLLGQKVYFQGLLLLVSGGYLEGAKFHWVAGRSNINPNMAYLVSFQGMVMICLSLDYFSPTFQVGSPTVTSDE